MLLLAGLIAARSSDADQENVRSASELRPFKPCTSGGPGAISTTLEEMLEAGVGIEPAYTDLQSAAWPLCHPAAAASLMSDTA